MYKKKMVAPIVISLIMVIYYIGFAFFCVTVGSIPLLAKLLGIFIPLILAGVCIYVLIERINDFCMSDNLQILTLIFGFYEQKS
mgnify:CR=1 FL=1